MMHRSLRTRRGRNRQIEEDGAAGGVDPEVEAEVVVAAFVEAEVGAVDEGFEGSKIEQWCLKLNAFAEKIPIFSAFGCDLQK